MIQCHIDFKVVTLLPNCPRATCEYYFIDQRVLEIFLGFEQNENKDNSIEQKLSDP